MHLQNFQLILSLKRLKINLLSKLCMFVSFSSVDTMRVRFMHNDYKIRIYYKEFPMIFWKITRIVKLFCTTKHDFFILLNLTFIVSYYNLPNIFNSVNNTIYSIIIITKHNTLLKWINTLHWLKQWIVLLFTSLISDFPVHRLNQWKSFDSF